MNDANAETVEAWQVQLRSRNLNGTLVGSWRQATEAMEGCGKKASQGP